SWLLFSTTSPGDPGGDGDGGHPGVAEPGRLLALRQDRQGELWVAVVVAAICLVGGMLIGVAAGVALTLGLVVRHVNQPRAEPLYPTQDGGWTTTPPDPRPPSTTYDGALVLRLVGGLYAGNARPTVD